MADIPQARGQTPLPQGLKAAFDPARITADFFYLPTPAGVKLRASLTFQNTDQKSVSVTYLFAAANALPGEQLEEYVVSFHPTAVCKRAGRDNVIYVAGWSERTSQTIVEEWEFSGGAVGSAMPPGGAVAVSTLAVPALTRTLLRASSAIGPVAAIGFNAYGDFLYLMEEAQPKQTWKIDVESAAAPTLAFSAGTVGYELLAQCNSMSVALHPNAGLVMYFEKKRKWVSGVWFHEPYTLVVTRDVDMDGDFDVVENVTYHDLYTIYPTGTWQVEYP